ncbi:MAG: HlyD family efflux transporter periplasmic adaptor subunit [Planctomycetota bacterium]
MLSRHTTLTLSLVFLLTNHVVAQDEDRGKESAPLVVENAQTSLIQNTKIASPLAGIVSKVHVTEGQIVKIDASLIRLTSQLAENELRAAKAALLAATIKSENDVNLRYAQRTLEVRENEMRQSQIANETYPGAVSRMELEELTLQVDQAALAIEQAEQEMRISKATSAEKAAAVETAQSNVDRHHIRSPVEGMITQIDIAPGEWVEAGKPVVRVISLDPLRIECFVDGRQHGRELIGRKVSFLVAGAAKETALRGKVSFVSPELQPVTGQVRLWATVENPDRKVGAGVSGTLTILNQQASDNSKAE